MKILVTGGEGTIGKWLVKKLKENGHSVLSIDIMHGTGEVGFSLRTDEHMPIYARCDISEYRQLARIFKHLGPFDIIFHTAAELVDGMGKIFTKTYGEQTSSERKISSAYKRNTNFDWFIFYRRKYMVTGQI